MAQLFTGQIINTVREDNKYKRLDYLKKPINITALGLSSTINAMSLLCENQLLGLSMVLSLASLGALIAQYFTYYDTYEEKCLDQFIEKLHNIPEYQEAINIYKSFIKDLVLYFDYLKIKKPLDICLYCKLMLDNGYFSYHHVHEYRDYDFVAPCDYRLLGGRVFTGTSVCRHMAIFFTDVLKETGATVTPLMVRCYEPKDLNRPIIKTPKPDHLIVGIKDEQGKFVYDPTNGVTATNSKNKSKVGDIVKGVLSNNYYFVLNKQYEERFGQEKEISDEYKRTNYMEFDRKELMYRKRMILKFFAEHEKYNDYFYKLQYDKISAIANYQHVLCPEKEGKEFKW